MFQKMADGYSAFLLVMLNKNVHAVKLIRCIVVDKWHLYYIGDHGATVYSLRNRNLHFPQDKEPNREHTHIHDSGGKKGFHE